MPQALHPNPASQASRPEAGEGWLCRAGHPWGLPRQSHPPAASKVSPAKLFRCGQQTEKAQQVGLPLGDQSWARSVHPASGGALLAPPLLQRPAHPHGHHGGVSVIELHDERVALWARGGSCDSHSLDFARHLFTAFLNSPVRWGQLQSHFIALITEAQGRAVWSLSGALAAALTFYLLLKLQPASKVPQGMNLS